jgi:superfamily I DNA and RNA helicase
MTNAEELERALAYPWAKWTVFLHPAQRALVERSYSGPARVAGSAGTGKTIVALHRAAWLARQNPDARVLLTTFSQ